MKAYIITIGTEILIGQTNDTNSTWLASELAKLGFTVDRIISIPDKEDDIIDTLKIGLDNADLIVFTGGLGPTNDDITKTTLTKYYGSDISFSDAVYNDILSFLEQRGGKMNNLNKLQATVPKKAVVLPNKQGTAPGLLFEQNNKICISLPGVPFEMKGIMNEFGFDIIKEKFHLPYNFFHTTLITGIAESHLAERIADWENNLPLGMNVAYLPSPGIIRLRLGLVGINEMEVKQKVMHEADKLEMLIPELLFGKDEQTLEKIVSELLVKLNMTLATAESCTGGNIARVLTSVPGSSNWYNGSIVAYSNQSKHDLLNVSEDILELHGAVSSSVVECMAKGAKRQLKTDYAIATSGIAGPDGGTDVKPVGTIWIGLSGPNGEVSELYRFGKERSINVKRTTIAALNMLRKELIVQLKHNTRGI